MGEGEIIYLSLHRHHQNDSCIKIGSDESHFNVSLIVRDSHKTVSTDHNFSRGKRAEADSNRGPTADQPNALPLSQTGSDDNAHTFVPHMSASHPEDIKPRLHCKAHTEQGIGWNTFCWCALLAIAQAERVDQIRPIPIMHALRTLG